MSLSLLVPNSDEQRRKVLIDLTQQALSDSSRLISSLGQSEIKFKLDSISRLIKSDLNTVFHENESNMVAVSQRLEGSNSGHILFMLPEPSALVLIKKLLNERNLLKEMTEMEEESLTEVGNIIINNCLRYFVKVFHESISGLIPTLSRGHYEKLVDTLINDASDKDIYLVKINVAIGIYSFNGYILWLGHLCQVHTGPSLPYSSSVVQD